MSPIYEWFGEPNVIETATELGADAIPETSNIISSDWPGEGSQPAPPSGIGPTPIPGNVAAGDRETFAVSSLVRQRPRAGECS